jgi:hypothetical protein
VTNTFFVNDSRNYTPILEGWLRIFICTMDEGILEPGNDSGIAPSGVKIIFDGYGDLETEEEYIEAGDKSQLSFAIFIHKDSLTKEFPPHEQTPWALIHRPKEEVCVWAWYNEDTDEVDIIPFEDNNSTELDHKLIYDIIDEIEKRSIEND